jgi:hypothetical protein
MNKLIKPNRDALEEYFNERNVSEKTNKNYIYMFIRIQELLRKKIKNPNILKHINKLLEMLDEQYLVAKENNFAREMGLKPVISLMFLKILLLMIKNKKDYGRVKDAIELYEKRQSNYTASKSKKQIKENDISYDKIISVLKDPQTSDIDYILLYLLVKLGVRNTDLTFVYLQEQPAEQNYMYIDKNSVIYVRNRYKLVKTFGRLENKITDKRFVNIIKNMIENGKQFVFMNRKDTSYSSQTIGHYIKQQTNKLFDVGLTESVIYKVIMSYYRENGDEKSQIKIAKSRPHTLITQAKYYE